MSVFINIKHQFSRYTTMMNQEDIFKKIGQILNELNEQYQYLAQNPEELNELELELFLANSSFLTDHVQIVRKLNSKSIQKALPEHALPEHEMIEQQPVIPVKIVDEHNSSANLAETHSLIHGIEEDIFKIDKEPSTFEFILNDKPSSDKFEFEEKSIDEIFDRPLSKEEAQIIAQKQKLRELDSLESELPEEDEIGPEPFLVSEPLEAEEESDVTGPDEDEFVENEPAEAEDIAAENAEEDIVGETNFEQHIIEEDIKEENAEPFKEPELVETPDVSKQEPNEGTEPVAETKPYTEPIQQSELFSPVSKVEETPVSDVPEEQPKAKPTLNDILSGNNAAKNFNTGAGRIPVTDLKQAISLNDKMRYIKDLFNGYNLAYAEAIDLLNKMPDFKTADAFLQNNYAVKNNWASRQDTADQFYELLNQRFPAK